MPILPSSTETENAPEARELLWDASECIMQLGCEADEELLHEIIVTFIDDSRQRIAGLHEALGSEESTALRRQAHSLKGSANQIGAKPMAALCKQLEQREGERPHDQLLALLEQLDSVFLATTQTMLAHFNTRL